jgi:5-methyltetrahydropteroyltriglutamate--homocysteine methyltransferase
MTMVDTLYDAHYKEPREARLGVRRDPERGGARDRRDGRRRDPVRRARVQRVLRRGARLGRETLERAAQGLTARRAVHICYGYGIKANNDWKKTLGGEWRQYEQTFPLLAASRSTRCRSNARTRTCRSS